MFPQISRTPAFERNFLEKRCGLSAGFYGTPLRVVFPTLFSVFGYPDKTLSLVFDILLSISNTALGSNCLVLDWTYPAWQAVKNKKHNTTFFHFHPLFLSFNRKFQANCFLDAFPYSTDKPTVAI